MSRSQSRNVTCIAASKPENFVHAENAPVMSNTSQEACNHHGKTRAYIATLTLFVLMTRNFVYATIPACIATLALFIQMTCNFVSATISACIATVTLFVLMTRNFVYATISACIVTLTRFVQMTRNFVSATIPSYIVTPTPFNEMSSISKFLTTIPSYISRALAYFNLMIILSIFLVPVCIANLFRFNRLLDNSIFSTNVFDYITYFFGRTGLCLILACIIGIFTMSGMSSTVELAAANLSATILPRNRAMNKKKGQQSDKVAKNATNNKSKSKTSTNQSVVSTKQAPAAEAIAVLDVDTPLVSADKFLETFYSHQGVQTLRFYTKEYWQWDGNAYRKIDADGLRSQLMHFLEKTVAIVKAKGEIVDYMPFPVTSTRVNNIEKVLKSRLYNPADESTPCWISGDIRKQPASVKDPKMLIFCKNTILNLEDMKTLPHSPHWFNLAALDYDYDSKAKCPKWDKFLDSVFGDDKESKQAIMEFMGLCLTCITKFQKALLLIGPKRSGKGTIARIMEKVIGKHNMAPQGTSDFAMDFGFESLVGKTLSITADARFSKNGLTRTTEKILNIVGEDQVKINKKMKDAFHLRMPTKLMFMTNHVPHFPDASGALPSRFITVRLFNSFFGKEDLDLEEKLSAELPGILNYAIKSLKDLLKRGRFIQPKTGMQAVEQMTALSSPIRDFIEDLEEYEHPDSIWEKWGKFCKATREPVRTQKELWANLTAAGYDCDFDAITIMDAVADCGGKATIRDLRDCSRKFHDDPKMLQGKVDEMVKAELLMQFEVKVAGNHKLVVTYMLKPKPIQRK